MRECTLSDGEGKRADDGEEARDELPLRLCTGTYNPGDDGVVDTDAAEEDKDDHEVERGIAIGEDMSRMLWKV